MPSKHRCNSGSDSDGMTPPKKRSGSKVAPEEYRIKRDRNNVAVRKSREKTRQKAKETMQKVNLLKQENEDLEMKVTLLSKELNLLKDLFLSHASGGGFADQSAGVPIKTETVNISEMDSSGETDNSIDSVDSTFMDLYESDEVKHGAGTYVNAEAIQKDHEYSVPLPVK